MKKEAALKRLRFPYHPESDESLVGAFAAACRETRLRHVVSGLEGAGLRMTRPGDIQVASSETLERLATVMRTDVARLASLVMTSDGRSVGVDTNLIMPRGSFNWRIRRIGPLALRDKAYHRSAWLNTMLPYCPESLERLVEACPTCGPLGWRHTRGIGACETCGEPVPPSSEPGLPIAKASDYRRFAALMARNRAVAATAVAALPPFLRGFSRTALVAVATRAATCLTTTSHARPLEVPLKGEPQRIAEIVCEGMRLLSGWPEAIQARFQERAQAMTDDPDAYAFLRRAMRWVGGVPGSEAGRLLEHALPDLDGRTVHVCAGKWRYYTTAEANRRLLTSSAQLTMLRERQAVRCEILPSRMRVRARYDAEDVDALRARLDGTMPVGTVASRLDVPVYAIGQLARADRLVVEEAVGVSVLRGRQIERSSLNRLQAALQAAASSTRVPSDYVKLRKLFARRAGERPWGPVVELVLNGSLPFHLSESMSLRDAWVDPRRLPRLRIPFPDMSSDPLRLQHVSLRDAQDVLGTRFATTVHALGGHEFVQSRGGRGDRVDRGALRSLAATVAFLGEVAARNEWAAGYALAVLSRSGLPTCRGGWSRQSLLERDLVDPVVYEET
ncbi:hypothetical protein [Sphingomonas sp. RIT328]|uniref:hypothetical protein n=1 Tax=Sphingomonas sp. RIT328 TaxID=1470591 RepID=UPI00044A92A6|nr:hypothetical protein [Sphingomonas sp. RIT328]EZP49937.1 hypothetical protein BW41_03262 [Sphingomonas sp. RIT328]